MLGPTTSASLNVSTTEFSRNLQRRLQRTRHIEVKVGGSDLQVPTSVRSVHLKGKRLDLPRQFCALYLSNDIKALESSLLSGVKCHDVLLGLFASAATANMSDVDSIRQHLVVRSLVFRNNCLKPDHELQDLEERVKSALLELATDR